MQSAEYSMIHEEFVTLHRLVDVLILVMQLSDIALRPTISPLASSLFDRHQIWSLILS